MELPSHMIISVNPAESQNRVPIGVLTTRYCGIKERSRWMEG